MSQARDDIAAWIAQGQLAPESYAQALREAGEPPGPAAWRHFLDRLALWLGALFCGAAAIFFLAYNWERLGRFGKFALAEILLAAALGTAWRCGLERASGKAALLAASLLTGALLALIGQIYQTGADTFELFAAWALAILAWVLLARLDALWMLWLALLNLAAVTYFQARPGQLLFFLASQSSLWTLLGINTLALAAWEAAQRRGLPWLQRRWGPRMLATASGMAATVLAAWFILDTSHGSAAGLLAYLVWLAVAYVWYRRLRPDVFILAGGVFSLIVVVTVFLARHLGRHDAGGFLLTGMAVIGLSALGGAWLKKVAREGVSA